MKHVTRKITLGLLATTLTLSANTVHPPSTLNTGNTVSQERMSPNTAHHPQKLNDPGKLIESLRRGEAQLEQALLSGAQAQDELTSLKTRYKQLMAEYTSLSEDILKLQLENVTLKTENETYRAERKGTWERFKSWISTIDATKVASAVITGIFTIIAALVAILL